MKHFAVAFDNGKVMMTESTASERSMTVLENVGSYKILVYFLYIKYYVTQI